MSEATLEAVDTNEINDNAERIDKGGYFLEKAAFTDGGAAGFEFYKLQFKSVDAAVEKYGTDKVLSLVNSAVNFALRAKAKNKLPNPEGATKEQKQQEWDKLRNEGKTLLLTTEDAEAYAPGEREISSFESILRAAKVALKEGRKEEAQRLRAKAMAIMNADFSED